MIEEEDLTLIDSFRVLPERMAMPAEVFEDRYTVLMVCKSIIVRGIV